MGPANSDLLDHLPLILAILGIGIVSIVGWLIWIFTRPGGWRGSEPKQQGGEAPGEAAAPAQQRAPGVREPVVTPSLQSQPPTHFLALSRGIDEWEIYVQGQRYGSLDAVPDTQTSDEVVDAIRALARFANDYMQRRRAAGGTSSAGQTGTSRLSSQPPARTPSRAPDVGSGQRPLTVSPLGPGTDPALRRPPTTPSMIPTINLAQEIGEIVDEMVGLTPTLQGHSVSLTNAPSGGITFVVDGKIYKELDEIPHPEVRELIRRATKEWERR